MRRLNVVGHSATQSVLRLVWDAGSQSQIWVHVCVVRVGDFLNPLGKTPIRNEKRANENPNRSRIVLRIISRIRVRI